MMIDNKAVQFRIEELIREELIVLGESEESLTPERIAQCLRCEVEDKIGSYTYFWKDFPVFRAQEEKDAEGNTLRWRFFTQEDL